MTAMFAGYQHFSKLGYGKSMKRTIHKLLFAAILMAIATMSMAQNVANEGKSVKPPSPQVVLPAGITEEMLAPPPMPHFMLEKPAKPLTMDEMIQQAQEAEKKAGAGRKSVGSAPEAQRLKPSN